jgi:hypothetical protein
MHQVGRVFPENEEANQDKSVGRSHKGDSAIKPGPGDSGGEQQSVENSLIVEQETVIEK